MKSLISLFFLLFLSLTAGAENEPNHRYDVEGYLLDADRQPLPETGISISSGNQILGSTRSDSDGYYFIRLHLHNSSIGRRLVLTTAKYSGSITMTANSADSSTRRRHFANFIDGKLVEGELEGLSSARWMYYTGAALVIVLIAVVAKAVKRRRKRRRRQLQNKTHGSRHGKRRKRRKH